MTNDPIADFLTRIRNALMMKRETVKVNNSKMTMQLSEILLKEGYISSFEKAEDGIKKHLYLQLKYDGNSESVITGLKRLSKSGLRVYSSVKELPTVRSGMGFAIVSTSKGVMTCNDAREGNIGGELICSIW